MVEQRKALSVKQGTPLGNLTGCIGMILGFIFCSMFFGIGCIFLWMIALSPFMQILAARSWEATPCTITKSEVQGNETFKIVIEYDYEFQGVAFHGERYDFFSMSTNGRASKERIIARYKEGTRSTCYVDPNFPSESVISRAPSSMLWWGLFPLPFISVGLGGYWFVFFGQRKLLARSKSKLQQRTNELSEAGSYAALTATRVLSQSEWSDSNYDEEDLYEEPGALTLKADSSPFAMALVLLAFSVFWNGIVSIFVFERLPNWGKLDLGFEDLFLVPFVLVGIGLFGAVIYTLLASLNPKPILVLSRQLIPLGGAAELQWSFPLGTGSIRQFNITLVGVEEATYRRGTSTHTDTSTFCEDILLETNDPHDFAAGQIQVTIPTNSMHSFHGGKNKVQWTLQLHGEIPFWPDVKAKFPIRVVPHE